MSWFSKEQTPVSERTVNRLGQFSLAFGGFLLLAFAAQAYFAIWRGEFLPGFPGPRRLPEGNAAGFLLSPFSVGLLLCGIFLVANGYFLLRYVRQRELGQTHKDAVWSVLTPDEKSAVSALEGRGGELTQKELSLLLGFSAVKAHRVLQRLEEKKLVRTHPFGMTKKIILAKMDAAKNELK